jgi:FkbM family methyltransferase
MAKEFTKIFNRALYTLLPKYSGTTFVRVGSRGWRLFTHRRTGPDRGVIKQIFFKQDYLLDRLARKNDIYNLYDEIRAAGKTPLIIDCGANIGASSVWFHTLFPHAHIIAIEPDTQNYSYLTRNTTGIDIDARRAAIGCDNGFVRIMNEDEGSWAFRTEAVTSSDIPRLSLNDIIESTMRQDYIPLIVKIDIEGAEDDLFAAHTQWIDQVPLIIIELHDWMLPQQRTSHSFLQAVADRDRDFVSIGENVFSIKNKRS